MLVVEYYKRERWKIAQVLPGGHWPNTYRCANLSSIQQLMQLLYPTVPMLLIKATSISLQPLRQTAQIYLALDLMIRLRQMSTAWPWPVRSTERRVGATKSGDELHSSSRKIKCLQLTITSMAVNLQDTFVSIQNVRLLARHTNYQVV